jgi:putative copper export protein
MDIVFYLHLVAATVWIGGLIVVAALVPAVRKVTTDREIIRAIARRFGVISWIALGTLVLTGAWMAADRLWDTVLITKVSLVLVSAVLAAWHTLAARNQSPALRGAVQGVILILALVILGLAINL